MLTTKNVDRNNLAKMMLQYAEIKDNYPNDIVLIRVGDFYEAYFEDAFLMSSLGDIRLTAKRIGSKKEKEKDLSATETKYTTDEIMNSQILIPLAGFPHKHIQPYSQKLISLGKRVVVVEQMEDPKTVKNRLVRREVVKIISSIDKDDTYLSPDANNFLCIIYPESNKYGICFADVYTGDIYLTTVNNVDTILNEIASHKPNELLLTNELNNILGNQIETKLKMNLMKTIDDNMFKLENTEDKILSCFKIDSLDEIEFHSSLEQNCLATLLNYIEYTEMLNFNFDKLPICYDFTDYMSIDMYSRSNLELTENVSNKTQLGTLYSILNKCKTSMGGRLLRQYIEKPLLNRDKIEDRLEAVTELLSDEEELRKIHQNMFGILDISRIMGRIKMKNSIPRDLINLRESLRKIPELYSSLNNHDCKLLNYLHSNMNSFEDLIFLLDKAILDDAVSDIRDGLVIKPGYNSDLDTARDMISNSNKYFSDLEEKEREKTGFKKLRIVNKNGKCTIEVPENLKKEIPDYYILEKSLKDTIRYTTEETEKLQLNLYSAIERSKAIEIELYEEIKTEVLKENHKLQELCDIIAILDVICSLAITALENNYVCPTFNNDGYINIIDGRHPVVEVLSKDKFITNDTNIDMDENNFILLTGPNMAGKSTYMRQIALITIMAHIGSFVPATSANIPIIDKVFTRIGASDDISSGRSTYMVEMVEVKNILENATVMSLVLLDEVGRGTSTSDGLSIAQALSEYIHDNIKCKTLFATHYHELIELGDTVKGFKNYHMSVEKENGSLNFIRKIKEGGLSESYGIDVAKMAGIPDIMIDRAWDILNHIEKQKEGTPSNNENKDILDFINKIDRGNMSPISAYKTMCDLFELIDNKL